jgi:[protein-PII] uridylyltransferase
MLTSSLWEVAAIKPPAHDNITALRNALADGQSYLLAQFEQGADVVDLVHMRARYVDQALQHLWARDHDDQFPACLLAVGGYGRGELHPYSDIDLLLLLDKKISQKPPESLSNLLTQLWDMGLEIGHSVRSLAECREQAENDITIATNLLETRYLCGDHGLFDQLQQLTVSNRTWETARFYRAKHDEQRQRHQKYNDTANNLEPNIKESPGGLRDLQVISWVAQQHFAVKDFHGLLVEGFLAEREYQTLTESEAFLWKIRFALHHRVGRKEERLQIDHQRALASQFGYQDTDARMAVEQFMKDYYLCARRVGQMNSLLLQLFEEAIILEGSPREVIEINSRFHIHNDYLATSNPSVFAFYPYAMLELFLILQQHPEIKGVRAKTIRQLHAHIHLIDDAFRADIKCRSLFMEIIRQPRGISHEFGRMNQFGVLGAYLPNFGVIVGQMQHDMFHAYTVDEHTLFLVRNLRRFSCTEFSDEFPLCSSVFYELPKPELLYLAGLFHDIAKGRGGNHSQLGIPDALAFCKRHDLSYHDGELVAWLVGQHLAMSATAQSKDTSDPEVITEFAELMGSVDKLNYLYLLTVADIRATNNNLWNNWRDSLLKQLYHNTKHYLSQEKTVAPAIDEQVEGTRHKARLALQLQGWNDDQIDQTWHNTSDDYFLRHTPDEIAWQIHQKLSYPERDIHICLRPHGEQDGTLELFVSAPDKPGLFATIVSGLEALKLDVLDAKINETQSGHAINTFIIYFDGEPSPENDRRIKDTLRQRLAERSPTETYQPSFIPRTLKLFETLPDIHYHHAGNHSVLEIKTHNRPGLLSVIAQVLLENKVHLLNAKLTSLGDQVENIFFISNYNHTILSDEKINRLQAQLESGLTAGIA